MRSSVNLFLYLTSTTTFDYHDQYQYHYYHFVHNLHNCTLYAEDFIYLSTF